MIPRIPANLLEVLRRDGTKPPWICKLHLRQGRTVYVVEISKSGEIKSVGGRAIYGPSDIGFDPKSIESVSV